MGGHWGQRGLGGHWGHTNLKTMINDSTENNSLFKRENFFSIISPSHQSQISNKNVPNVPSVPNVP
ncbi:MAG: hypothetical protein LBB88_07525 [Planctomycetaceae bacterium]|nr:hypothetical protein [Planctomycetaceae bacterium]